MRKLDLISKSGIDTMNIAKELAKYMQKGDIIVLTGELGAGKTKFTEGFASYFNLQDEISSPTFNIVNEYKNDKATIYHFDVYRLEDVEEFYAIGGEEYFLNGICVIEWGEMIEEALPHDYLKINFSKMKDDNNKRIIDIIQYGERFKTIDFKKIFN